MDKQLAMELMVKCADISNVIKPTEVARRWALRVTDEFFQQGDAERSMGMEVSPTCDRLATSRVAIQTGFIDFLAGPLFTALAAAFPAAFQAPLAQLAANRAGYARCTDVELEVQSRDVLCSASVTSATHTEEGGGGSSFGSHGERTFERCDSVSSETQAGVSSTTPSPFPPPSTEGGAPPSSEEGGGGAWSKLSTSRVEWFKVARCWSGLERTESFFSETEVEVEEGRGDCVAQPC
jgi:hypothetical protein